MQSPPVHPDRKDLRVIPVVRPAPKARRGTTACPVPQDRQGQPGMTAHLECKAHPARPVPRVRPDLRGHKVSKVRPANPVVLRVLRVLRVRQVQPEPPAPMARPVLKARPAR